MSVASILNQNDDITFSELNAGVINCDVLNATVVNGGGGGSGVNITSSDSSITVTNGVGTVNLTNAGQNWSQYKAIAEVDMQSNSFLKIAGISFSSFTSSKPLTMYQGFTNATGLNGLYITDGQLGAGNIGNVYDSQFNKPTLSDILQASGDGAGGNISNVNSVIAKYQVGAQEDGTAPSMLILGNNDVSIASSTCSWQLLHNNTTNDCALQYYNKTGLIGTIARFSQNGTVYFGGENAVSPQIQIVGKGGLVGTVYDSTFNKPPSSSGGASTIAYTTGVNAVLAPSTSRVLQWTIADSANVTGKSSIVLQSDQSSFKNAVSKVTTPITVQVSCYVIWGKPSNPTTAMAIYGTKNGVDSDRYGYQNIGSGSDFPSTSCSFTVVLNQNDFFSINVWHNDSASIMVPNVSLNLPNARIVVTQLN